MAVATKTARILVVDDDSDLATLMAAWLEEEGHIARPVSDDLSAYHLARGFQPQLILMDVRMPNLSGWSELRLFQQDPDLQGVPTVVVSGDPLAVDQRVPRGYPVYGHLAKPFTKEELLRQVEQALEI